MKVLEALRARNYEALIVLKGKEIVKAWEALGQEIMRLCKL
jgi:hypothetical protein